MSKTYIIAEIGINHNGDMKLAKYLIRSASKSGCDAVKFQKRTIDLVYSKDELDKYRESPWGKTNREQKEGLEFNDKEYKELESYSKQKGLDFIVSCWDLQSIDDIESLCDVKYHKVASALVTNREFLERLNETGKPVIISTGMCTQKEIDSAISILDNTHYILACTSTYPTKPEEINLKYITTLKKRFPNIKIGFSNHYSGLNACMAAAAFSAECIEFHITKDRTMYGSDQAASIESADLLVSGVRAVELMVGDGIKRVYETEIPIMEKLRKVHSI